ncbi:ribose 5-phosphate isomerase B [Ornithobacterium rhinotracheale]|uniref:Ribose 5-phosphate isomerase B n=1 Tax=Ornithobacterium rhinotracheale TaxID=28251 RepID=A0A3R5XT84_ORNRH|nr:ribose 5-phosphate isomerase B [Ornithobacterium rhinotracheale]QAR29863.1 ribose 5-phosphate isomerase B [Ornithobacterium rhinotracheale]
MKIAIGSDHAGYDLKEKIKQYLAEKKIEIQDFGAFSTDSVDYPDFAHPTANAVENHQADLGILLCGSGNGIAMTANKHQGIRAAISWNPELAELARQHNDANILVLPARFISEELGLEIVDAFLNASFEGGRHQRRVEKIACGK